VLMMAWKLMSSEVRSRVVRRFSRLKIKPTHSTETSVMFYQNTQCHIPEVSNLYSRFYMVLGTEYLTHHLNTELSIYLFICLSINPSIYLSIYPFIHLSIHLPIHPSIYRSRKDSRRKNCTERPHLDTAVYTSYV
jgi:hypothetical protein